MGEVETVYSTYLDFPSCHVLTYLDYSDRCAYISGENACEDGAYLLNYLKYLYCTLNPGNNVTHIIYILHLLTIIALLFYITSKTADEYFCPPLRVLSVLLHLNEHLAGITLLAFGNGSPDLFTTLVSLEDTNRLFYNDISGGLLLIMGVVIGLVSITSPFETIPSNFLKDALFCMLGALMIDYAMGIDGRITIWEAALIFALYFIYILSVVIDQFLVKRELLKLQNIPNQTAASQRNIDELKSQAELELSTIVGNERKAVDPKNQRNSKSNVNIYLDTLLYLNPIDVEEFKQGHWFKKIWIILSSPIKLGLRLFIPLCDYEMERHGWYKLLNCLQFVYMPFFVLWFIFPEANFWGIPVFLAFSLITLPLGILMFWFCRADSPPKFHWIFAIYGVVGSILIIYICSNEVVEILVILGLTTGASNAFLGCTVLALGNQIGDMVANVALARQGYQKMAFSACFGGPLFNAHLTLGFVFLYNAINNIDNVMIVKQGPLRDTLFVFLLLLNLSIFFVVVTTNYFVRRSTGALAITIYGIFFLYAILGEAEVVQQWSDNREMT